MGLQRYRTAFNTIEWMKPLAHLVYQYNNTITRVHKMKPRDVFIKPKSAWKVYEHFFLQPSIMDEKDSKKKKKPRCIIPKNLPEEGDYVRISRIKHPFEKESTKLGQFSREVFKVTHVDKSDKIPTFKLVDLRDQLIKGSFLPHEIQKIKYDPKNLFEIEKIVGKPKMIRGVKHVKVKWKGYNNRFNSWIPEVDIAGVPNRELVSHVD